MCLIKNNRFIITRIGELHELHELFSADKETIRVIHFNQCN